MSEANEPPVLVHFLCPECGSCRPCYLGQDSVCPVCDDVYPMSGGVRVNPVPPDQVAAMMAENEDRRAAWQRFKAAAGEAELSPEAQAAVKEAELHLAYVRDNVDAVVARLVAADNPLTEAGAPVMREHLLTGAEAALEETRRTGEFPTYELLQPDPSWSEEEYAARCDAYRETMSRIAMGEEPTPDEIMQGLSSRLAAIHPESWGVYADKQKAEPVAAPAPPSAPASAQAVPASTGADNDGWMSFAIGVLMVVVALPLGAVFQGLNDIFSTLIVLVLWGWGTYGMYTGLRKAAGTHPIVSGILVVVALNFCIMGSFLAMGALGLDFGILLDQPAGETRDVSVEAVEAG